MKRLRPNARRLLIKLLIAIVILGFLAWIFRDDLDRESLIALGKRLPIPVFVIAFLLTPVLGFPISILLFLAGLRLGFPWGMALATGGMFVHSIVAYFVTHGWFRDRLRARLERAGYGIPPIDRKHQAWFTALFAAFHGPPYAIKLYLLALTDVSFRIYLWVGTPVYILFALLPVGAGSAVTDLNPGIISLLVGLMVTFTVLGLVLKKRHSKPSNPTS